MKKTMLSNTFLSFGVIALFCFAGLEVSGSQSDPLIPAFSALFIGCTAVLDRVGTQKL